ncbi:MAG: hypothetical protein OEM22_08805, partial [Acidimicrobiia bacterium]|nr:hypothetical protein [Acidimicrobiia bacterium]
FGPAYGVLSVVLLAGVYLFVTFEETSIETIEPQEQVEAFAPVETLPPGMGTTAAPTPPTTAAAPTTTATTPATTTTDGTTATTVAAAGDTWDGVVAAFFDPRCTACHGSAVQTSGLDLSSYDTALAGGGRGAGVVPGDAAASTIVQIMEAGDHPALLSAEEVVLLKEWIDAGAAEG